MKPALKPISNWVLIVSGLFALLGLMVSLTLLFSPQSVLQTVDLNANGARYLICIWAARQFAVGFIFGFSTIKKSRPMLTLSYLFFLVMNAGDILVGISQHNNSLTVGASVMCIVSTIMIYFINNNRR